MLGEDPATWGPADKDVLGGDTSTWTPFKDLNKNTKDDKRVKASRLG